MKDKHARIAIERLAEKMGCRVIFYDYGAEPNVFGARGESISSIMDRAAENVKGWEKEVEFSAMQRKLDALIEMLGVEFHAQEAKLIAVKKGNPTPRPTPDEGGRR